MVSEHCCFHLQEDKVWQSSRILWYSIVPKNLLQWDVNIPFSFSYTLISSPSWLVIDVLCNEFTAFCYKYQKRTLSKVELRTEDSPLHWLWSILSRLLTAAPLPAFSVIVIASPSIFYSSALLVSRTLPPTRATTLSKNSSVSPTANGVWFEKRSFLRLSWVWVDNSISIGSKFDNLLSFISRG